MPTKIPIAECEIKPRGGLSQACGKALLHQRQQAAGACDVSVIAHGRAEGLGGGVAIGCFSVEPGSGHQLARGCRPPDAGPCRMIEQPSS
jgi:hypothetical protein